MGQLFHYDNPVMAGIAKIARCIFLDVLWLVFCIPVFTIGTATSALYYTVEKTIKNDRSYVFQSFWGFFRHNFRQGTVMGLILLGIELVLMLDTWIMKGLLAQGMTYGNAYVLFLVLMILVLVYGIWCLSGLARFENTVPNLMKNSLYLMAGHPGVNLAIVLSIAFAALIIWLIPVTVLLMPVLSIWLASAPIEKVYAKHNK